MKTQHGNLHLEIQTSRKSVVGILRTSIYDNGKVKHTQHGRITGCTLEQLKLLQKSFREEVIPADSPEAFKILHSKEYGASFAILEIIKRTGLDKVLYSKRADWVNSVLAMIIGRLVYAGSKLSLSHMGDNSSLWELCGINKADVDKHCYEPLDTLLKRQDAIQQSLAKKHLTDGSLVLYDITSSYLEGEYTDSDLVDFGYNRDGKKSHEQIVIGLICNSKGCPVGVEVFSGNTKDSTTVNTKIGEIKNKYGINKAVFVGDRGMVTQCNLNYIKQANFSTITALSRNSINTLIDRSVIQPSLFDENNICEITDPENNWRYCLCKNPQQAERNKSTREALLGKVAAKLNLITNYKRATTVAILGSRIGKILKQYAMGKYITWEVLADKAAEKSVNHRVIWQLNQSVIDYDALLDGCYVVTSDVDKASMDAQEIVKSYKSLILVENAFRNLKTVTLEIRPIYHKKDERIKAHVFLCMLAYYIQWHMKQDLQSINANTSGKSRKFSFSNIIQTLKQITKNKVSVAGAEIYKVSEPTPDQQKILSLLHITI